MSIQQAIETALVARGGWISAGELRDKMPPEMRGEGYQLALDAMVAAKLVRRRVGEEGGPVIYQLASLAPQPATPPATPPHASILAGQVELMEPLNPYIQTAPSAPAIVLKESNVKKSKSKEQEGSTRDRVLAALTKPLTTGELATKLKLSPNAVTTACKALEADKLIRKPDGGNQRSPWMLCSVKVLESTLVRQIAPMPKPRIVKYAADDIQENLQAMKLAVLAKLRKAENDPVTIFALDQIKGDLETLYAA